MTHIVVQCPKCGTRFKLKASPQTNGAKIVCKKCETPFRVRFKKPSRPKADDDEIVDVADDAVVDDEPVEDPDTGDEWGDSPVADDEFADELPPARPSKSRSSSPPSLPGKVGQNVFKKPGKKGNSKTKEKDAAPKEAPQRLKAAIVIVIVVAAVMVVGGLSVGAYFVAQAVKKGSEFVPPTKYVIFDPNPFPLSCKFPDGWAEKHGGGTGGQQAWLRFTSGSISISAQESISGGALGQAAIAQQQQADPHGQHSDVVSAVASIHDMQRHAMDDQFTDYEEEPSRKIQTIGYGEARISEFSAKDGFFKTPVKGCRATILNQLHQFTIICKCPPAQFDSVRPVFQKVVTSFNGGNN